MTDPDDEKGEQQVGPDKPPRDGEPERPKSPKHEAETPEHDDGPAR